MPLYSFYCDKCGYIDEVKAPIEKGPPSSFKCIQCGQEMSQEYSANFILKGNGWPGKELKKNDHAAGRAKEETEEMISKHNSERRVSEEVLKVRRKGRKAIKEFKKDNPQKFKEYKESMKKGNKAK